MTETETLFNGRWLRVKRRGSWEYCERVNPAGAVIIIALTDDDELVFVEQFRVPVQRTTIEMPAGLIGDEAGNADESALDSARRELEEEAGYRADRMEVVMHGPVSAGLTTETATFVRATGLTRVGAGGGNGTEEIVVHHVPRVDAPRWLADRMRAGYSIDPKLYAGLYFVERDTNGEPWPAARASKSDQP
ncbi:MAG TPA: NUDIX hydrolase [Candidatus Saccharimonadia bacterium]|nr:NUDIX hydrolase [Candidatus Saccharimonadia bacterium]